MAGGVMGAALAAALTLMERWCVRLGGSAPLVGMSAEMGVVLVVAGTHGNEINAPWLVEAWRGNPGLIDCAGLVVDSVLGNPVAHAECRRYLQRDLNRSFAPDLLDDPSHQELEVERARELIRIHGAGSGRQALVAIDLHSTTTAMGNSLVLYGRRPADLALAAGVQARLGLPIYLHEGDPAQRGFLVERWPCGYAVEVGPVPQGVLSAQIVRQTRLALEETLAVLARARAGTLMLPPHVVVHRHLGSLDLPRGADGSTDASIHSLRQGRDWQVVQPGDPLFERADGSSIAYGPTDPPGGSADGGRPGGSDPVQAVFINEAAYVEKGIALTLTRREVWPVPSSWGVELERLAARLKGDPPPQPQT